VVLSLKGWGGHIRGVIEERNMKCRHWIQFREGRKV